jgi:hypothetical protein
MVKLRFLYLKKKYWEWELQDKRKGRKKKKINSYQRISEKIDRNDLCHINHNTNIIASKESS